MLILPVSLLVLTLWLAGSVMDVQKYIPSYAPALLIVGLCLVVILLSAVRYTPRWFTPSRTSLILLWICIAGCFAVIHPIASRHVITQGNDSEDALYVGARHLLSGHFPYYSKTYLGSPITPMPGALILDLPFAGFGHAGLQNLIWLAVFLTFAYSYFKRPLTAFLFACIILSNGHTFVNIMTGADYPVNCFYVCTAIYCFLVWGDTQKGWRYWLSIVFLGVALSSRLTYILVVPIVLAGYCTTHYGIFSGLKRLLYPLLVTVAVTAPFYFYDPSHFSPLHVANFLSAMTPVHQHAVFIILTSSAVLVALSSFVLRMRIASVFLLVGFAACVILLPPGIIVAVHQHFTTKGVLVLGYTDTAYIFLCVWLCKALETQRETPVATSGRTTGWQIGG